MTAGDTRAGTRAGGRVALTVGLLLTVALGAFEGLAAGTVLPAVHAELGDLRHYGLVFSAFLLTNLVGVVLAGRWVDRSGPGRPFVAGAATFAAGLIGAAAAPSMLVLALARGVQGLGAGIVAALAYYLVQRCYPEERRPRMLALLSTAWMVAGLSGPALAGWLATTVGWRWVFLGLVPALPLSVLLCATALRGTGPGSADVGSGEADRAGAGGTASGSTTASSTAAARSTTTGSTTTASNTTNGTAAGSTTAGNTAAVRSGDDAGGRQRQASVPALAAAVVLAVVALAASGPVALVAGIGACAVGAPALLAALPDGTLRAARGQGAAAAVLLLAALGYFAVESLVPLVLTAVHGVSVTAAGLVLTAGSVTWAAGTWAQARLAPVTGRATVLACAAVITAAGVAGTGVVAGTAGAPPVAAAGTWALAAFGMGLLSSTAVLTVLERAAPGREGHDSSGAQLANLLGAAGGTAAGGALVAAAGDVTGTGGAAHLAAGIAAAAMVAAAVVASRVRTG